MKAVCLLIWLLYAGLAGAAEALQVEVRRDSGKIMLSGSFSAPVSKELAWAVMTDFEHMPQFLPNLKSSRILSREGHVWRVAQQGVIPLLLLDYGYESIRDIELTPMQVMHSHSVGGNAGETHAKTTLDFKDQQTRVQYSATWSPTSSLIASLGLDMMREQLGLHFRALQQEMLKRAKVQTAALPPS